MLFVIYHQNGEPVTIEAKTLADAVTAFEISTGYSAATITGIERLGQALTLH